MQSIDEIVSRLSNIQPETAPMYKELNDISCGRLFGFLFANELRYNSTQKEYMFYDGTVWKTDVGGMIAEQHAKALFDALRKYIGDINDMKFFEGVMSLGDRAKRKRMIDDARDFMPLTNEDLDADGNLFNCLNGTLDLTTFEFREHRAEDLLSKVARVNYDPKAESKDFDRFIHQVMQDDEEKILFLQKIFGYSFLADACEEKAYFLYGSTTRNGKSTLIETICEMFGDYSTHMQPESLALRPKDSRTASGDLARLVGIRFLNVAEIPRKMNLDVGLFKNLTGRDTITCRNLYEREFTFKPYFTLVVNTNFLPVVTDDTIFNSERVQVVTFDKHFTESEQDKGLKTRLCSEENLSGILNWCILGLCEYRLNGLTPPDSVRKATEEYRNQSDKTKMFFDDCMTENTTSCLRAGEVYEHYTDWCRTSGYYAEGKKSFFEYLKGKGLLSPLGTINGRTARNVVKGYDFIDDDSECISSNPFE